MFRLLIVDDEVLIADGLFDIFQNIKTLELDIYKAYSAFSALELLNKTRVDIVLTDIRMPGMDGLQLLQQIKMNWPHCRVIFLTGHNDFDYVYHAIQYKDVSYILKTEGNNKVISAVENAVRDIETSLKQDELVQKASKQMQLLSSIMQNEYLLNLIQGNITFQDSSEQFDKLNIALNKDQACFLLLGRIDSLPKGISYSEKQQLLYTIQMIAGEYFTQFVKAISVTDHASSLIWFIQPAVFDDAPLNTAGISSWSRCEIYVKGTLELVQAACRESLNVTVSFIINNKPYEWAIISQGYSMLSHMLNYRIGFGTEMLITESDKGIKPVEPDVNDIQNAYSLLKQIDLLEHYLERGQRQEYYGLLSDMTDCLSSCSIHYNPAVEIYYSIALRLLSYINRWGLTEKLAFRIGLHMLMRLDVYNSWNNAIEYLENISENIFEIQKSEQEKTTLDTIDVIKKYIDDNLDKELSLIKLADLVFLNPSYLSRLFKQVTSENLSDYISNARIKKARQLLENPIMKIHEAAEIVGYDSAANFARFFKKITGLTPQEYRDIGQKK